MDALWGNLAQLRQSLANSQMHLLAESLLDGRSPATLFYEYQRHRSSRDKAAYAQLHTLLTKLYQATPRDPLPWQAVTGDNEYSYQTALWDMAELYDFVPEES